MAIHGAFTPCHGGIASAINPSMNWDFEIVSLMKPAPFFLQ